MADRGRIPGAAQDAEFRGSVPQALPLGDTVARIERKRPHAHALKPGTAAELPA